MLRDAHLLSGVDYERRYGLVATRGADRHPIGHGIYIEVGEGKAELAFAIDGEMQGHGLGTILLAHLAEAAAEAGSEARARAARGLPRRRDQADRPQLPRRPQPGRRIEAQRHLRPNRATTGQRRLRHPEWSARPFPDRLRRGEGARGLLVCLGRQPRRHHDVASLLSSQPLPAGPRVGILTNAGDEAAALLAEALAAERSGIERESFLVQRMVEEGVELLAGTAVELRRPWPATWS